MPAPALSTLKLVTLQRLSCLLGLNVSGTKTTLVNAIGSLDPTPAPPTRILSIDMGIRNLAYCVIDLHTLPLPTLTTWTRTALPLSVKNLGPSVSLPAFAEATHTLATGLLRDHAPSHVLIELQRWRSGGGRGVLEWTIRVNTVEAMLHALLLGLRLAGKWDGHVESVDPGKVARLWVGKASSAAVKPLKSGVVRDWLRTGQVVKVGEGGPEMAAELLLLEGVRRAVKASGEKVTAEEKKVDDLADCVLQAAAWIRWQEGRKRLREGRMPLELDGVLPVQTPTPVVPSGLELDHMMDTLTADGAL